MSHLPFLGRIALVIALLAKMWVAPLLFLDYEIRKEYIIKNFCVNKSRPELHCDGKCYLAQRLQETRTQDERQATDQFLRSFFLVDHCLSETLRYDVTPSLVFLGEKVTFPGLGVNTPEAPILSLLIPPKLG